MLSAKHLLILILSLIPLQCFSQGFEMPGLVTYLTFNGNLDDQSGNGNNAEATDTIFTSDRFNFLNNALEFNHNFIKIPPLILGGNPSTPANVFSGDFTISFWEKSSNLNRAYAFSIDPGDGMSNNLNIEFNDLSDIYTYWNSDGLVGIKTGTSNQFTNNEWHHIVLRRTSSPHKIELFIDMVLLGTDSIITNQTIGSDTSYIYLGKNAQLNNPNVSAWDFIGKLDDIMIFNRAINNTEINTLYRTGIIANFSFEGNYNDDFGSNKLSLFNTTGDSSDLPNMTPGRFGCDDASYFNGKGYLKLETFSKNPDSVILDFFDKDFTISFWEKSNQTNQPMYALSIDDTTNTNNLNIKFNDVSGCEVSWNGGGNNITGGTVNQYTDNQWHHIVLRRNSGLDLVELFIDGILVGSKIDSSVTIGSNLTDIIIGHFDGNGWIGHLDDVLFYSGYLSNNEIYYLYNLPTPTIESTHPKLNESWAINSKHNIIWTSNFNGLVDIEYSSDGIVWNDIIKNLETSSEILNQYRWTIPASATTTYNIRIKKSGCYGLSQQFNIIPTQESTCYQWTNVTMNAPFQPRDGAGAIVYNNSMWLIGGWNPENPVGFNNTTINDVWKSADGLNWTRVKTPSYVDPADPNPPTWESRHCAGYVVYNGEMWIIGGDVVQGHYQNDVWKSKDGQSWIRVASDVPWRDRTLYYTLVFDGKIWVMGGQSLPNFAGGGTLIHYNDVWSSIDGINWISYPNASWEPRGSTYGSVVFNNRIWILGGSTYEGAEYNDVWSSEDGTNWIKHMDYTPWRARQFQNVGVFDGKMWVLGGMVNGENSNKVWYSGDGVNWYEVVNTPWLERHAASVYTYNDALWIIAGNALIPGTSTMIADVWKLTCLDNKPTSADDFDILIYPNPSENYIIVRMKNSIISQLNVRNILGCTLITKKVGLDIIEVNLSELPSGIYLMECIDENGFVKSKKFVKY